jgi:hypothetical protein
MRRSYISLDVGGKKAGYQPDGEFYTGLGSTEGGGGEWDYVVACDVVYNPSLYSYLVQSLLAVSHNQIIYPSSSASPTNGNFKLALSPSTLLKFIYLKLSLLFSLYL